MRLFIFFTACALACCLPALLGEAKGKHKTLPAPLPSPARELAATIRSNYRVVGLSCRDPQGAESSIALGVALLSSDDSQAFSLSLYLKADRDGRFFRQLAGKFTVVPDGIIFRCTNWSASSPDPFFFHAHPGDLTAFPGLEGRYACRITGDIRP